MKHLIRALSVVAHPDDETIWMGGMILQHPEWQWTIVSLCRKTDSDRAPKFKKVCEWYGAESIISDLDDEVLEPLTIQTVVKKIKENLPSKKFDYVFTHGANGEYGHVRHKEISRAVKFMTARDELSCESLFYFSYVPSDRSAPRQAQLKIPLANQHADWIIELDKETFEQKASIITALYGFRHPVFETLACSKKEAFQKETFR